MFRCADSSVSWQAEVESFIQHDLYDWRFDPRARSNDPRVLLLFDAGKHLIGSPRTSGSSCKQPTNWHKLSRRELVRVTF